MLFSPTMDIYPVEQAIAIAQKPLTHKAPVTSPAPAVTRSFHRDELRAKAQAAVTPGSRHPHFSCGSPPRPTGGQSFAIGQVYQEKQK